MIDCSAMGQRGRFFFIFAFASLLPLGCESADALTDEGTTTGLVDPPGDPTDGGAADSDAPDAPDAPDAGDTTDSGPPAPPLVDPGTGPWKVVPDDEVLAKCRLDPAKLAAADKAIDVPWAIVRYGLLCHEHKSEGMKPAEAWSTTKTLGALAAGMVAYRSKNLPKNGPMTGPFTDADRVDAWLTNFSYNKDARVGHVLAMVAHNSDLSLGKKQMKYDTVGTDQINSLSDILNTVIQQDTANLGANLEEFTQKYIYGPLGMTESKWNDNKPDKVFAYSWSTTVRDMARVGLLLLHKGVWDGERLLDADWIYKMSHPSFEDANTGYGYLTWLNASSNFTYGGIPGPPGGLQQGAQLPGVCAPVSVFPSHPHGLSDAPDCNYAAPYSCAQPLDVGVWQAVGLGGQLIQIHPGLDMVIIARDTTPVPLGPQLGSGMAAPKLVWEAVLPAVLAGDPKYAGEEAAFCDAYGANTYAPDLQ